MNIDLTAVAFDATDWDVKRAIGAALHGDDFFDKDPSTRPINFQVELNPGNVGIRHNGSGVLTLPSRKVGERFMKWLYARGNAIKVQGRKINFRKSSVPLNRKTTQILETTPYLDPDIEEEREEKLRKLDVGLHVDKVQFGIFYRRTEDPPNASRVFSNEYEVSHRNKGAGLLQIEYLRKLIRIQLGDPMTEQEASNIVINFANIRKMAIGFDFGNPFICFELLTPPIFQRERFNRGLTGDDWNDNRKFRQRIDSINPRHAGIAPYAHHMRVILHEERDIEDFAKLCVVAELGRPFRAEVEAFAKGFFSPNRLHRARIWFQKFDWPVVFQLEAILRNGLLNTDDLMISLRAPIEEICKNRPRTASTILRLFIEALKTRDTKQSPFDCFQVVCSGLPPDSEAAPSPLPPGRFPCHHVTVTPSRMLLEGPYGIQSNRVLREDQYRDYHDHFLRVDFRDEDHLQYRWERDVDGKSLLQDRVGSILKNGFELGGRHFEFLAYSNSALRAHSVWFVHPFEHPIEGRITAQSIRDGLGDFSAVIRSPSKYAARMAQAFTATDPSVSLSRDQWEDDVEDLGQEPYLFTDGIGTISRELGDKIWDKICEIQPNRKAQVKPWAYQIRFLGCKGMVVIDEALEGIKMRLRKSMNKFQGKAKAEVEIEIVKAFDRPGTTYLNRALIMILEDRGVEKKAFLKLQEDAVATIHMSTDSLMNSQQFLREHSLGALYGLSFILQCLDAVGMGMKKEKLVQHLQDPFIDRVLHYAKNDVLRGIKHGARIPIPGSYRLVGVADEGPAYINMGRQDVYALPEGRVFACIQRPGEEPEYIEGSVIVARSPVVHPGDAQRVWAIGKPPEDARFCFFRNLKNVIVFSSVGARSLPSCLAGGDLDGDEYSIIRESTLLPTEQVPAADYTPIPTRTIERDSTIEDICDFVVEYFNSDVLGLLSDRHLIIADQSKHGTLDPKCIELAQLCSQAVDYPKNGNPVDIHDAPGRLIPYKPDWKQGGETAAHKTDFYISTRAVGELYRSVNMMKDPPPLVQMLNGSAARPIPLSDSISQVLRPYIERHLHSFDNLDDDVGHVSALFRTYHDELKYICLTHALSDSPDSRLEEEEVVLGSILAECSQHQYRKDRIYRMRMHASVLVGTVQNRLHERKDQPEPGELRYGLSQAWLAWDYGMRNRAVFGASSFALIALGVIFGILEDLGDVIPSKV